MGRSLSPLLRQELANLDKDSSSRRSAMKVLKSYVKELDSKAIPHFLAEVSETKAPGSSPGECTISLYEVLARVHGRKIVPQIDNIMSTIMRTLSSSAGSFPLHQACSKVVPAIARYGIDPSTPGDEKTKIICSLCKPLCDALMGSQESVASGAALCLKALVEADNWKFASDDMVNEVCLKLAGALEEKVTQTNYHMGLVTALAKHNSLIAEAYARSFMRSGLEISTLGAAETNSQKRLSAIQMINSLMKCVDLRSISSELAKVVDAMEKCRSDQLEFLKVAASETLQTAKMVAAQKGSKQGMSTSPIRGSSICRRNNKSAWGAADIEQHTRGNGSPHEFASPESQTVHSFVGYDTFADSPMSIEQPSYSLEYSRRANRRLWTNDFGGVDVSLKDGLFLKACSVCDDSEVDFEQNSNTELSEANLEHKEGFTGFVQASVSNLVTRSTTPSPQQSRPKLSIDDIKIHSSPRRLIRSLQNQTDANSGSLMLESPTSGEVEQNRKVVLNSDNHSHNLNCKVKERRYTEKARTIGNQKSDHRAEYLLDGTESVSSTGDIPEDCACKILHTGDFESKNGSPVQSVRRMRYGKAVLGFVCGLALVFFTIILSTMRTSNEELYFDIVPT